MYTWSAYIQFLQQNMELLLVHNSKKQNEFVMDTYRGHLLSLHKKYFKNHCNIKY